MGKLTSGTQDVSALNCSWQSLFSQGKNSVLQPHAIIKLLGSPPEHVLTKETMQNVGTVVSTAVKATNYWELPAKEELTRAFSDDFSWQTPDFILSFPRSQGKALSAVLSDVDPLGMFSERFLQKERSANCCRYRLP